MYRLCIGLCFVSFLWVLHVYVAIWDKFLSPPAYWLDLNPDVANLSFRAINIVALCVSCAPTSYSCHCMFEAASVNVDVVYWSSLVPTVLSGKRDMTQHNANPGCCQLCAQVSELIKRTAQKSDSSLRIVAQKYSPSEMYQYQAVGQTGTTFVRTKTNISTNLILAVVFSCLLAAAIAVPVTMVILYYLMVRLYFLVACIS